MRFGAGAVVAGGPICGAIGFHFVEKLICPDILYFDLDELGDFVEAVLGAAFFYVGYCGATSVDYHIYWKLEKRID